MFKYFVICIMGWAFASSPSHAQESSDNVLFEAFVRSANTPLSFDSFIETNRKELTENLINIEKKMMRVMLYEAEMKSRHCFNINNREWRKNCYWEDEESIAYL